MERCEVCRDIGPVFIERDLPGGVIVLCALCKEAWQEKRRNIRRVIDRDGHPILFTK